jgi:hypothetical protein
VVEQDVSLANRTIKASKEDMNLNFH